MVKKLPIKKTVECPKNKKRVNVDECSRCDYFEEENTISTIEPNILCSYHEMLQYNIARNKNSWEVGFPDNLQ